MNRLGRYRLDAVEGVGAFATVWRAFDTELDAVVAIKVLADNWTHHADVRGRFLAEARFLRTIDDPRVVRVHDVGVQDGRPYFVMAFASGGTLADRVGHLTTDEAVAHAVEACRAVAVAHDAGVLHRDLKPSNLLVDAQGRLVLGDLGSAKQLAEASGYTVTTGTPAYMSPEQASGRPLDERSDVYSLGVLTHELLTGSVPGGGPLDRDRADVLTPTSAGSGVDRVVASAVATDPARRPASATALADALAAATEVGATPRWGAPAVLAACAAGFATAASGAWWLSDVLA